jgi:cytochrome c-type biogenesis protein
LNFWATWCGPCRSEMPDIQKLYETYETEGDNAVIILGVAAPGLGQEKDEAGIKAFLDESGYTYPTLMDTTGDLFSEYGISSFPTTFMIDREGNVFGYVSGALNEDMMKNIIEQTLEGKRK